MLLPMIVLAAAGILLLVTAPLIARAVRGRGNDTVGLTRIIQVAAVAILIVALLVRPRNVETMAVPPPPDAREVAP